MKCCLNKCAGTKFKDHAQLVEDFSEHQAANDRFGSIAVIRILDLKSKDGR